jgi:pimeloyl-ACP methyl ester carboxylesterase
MTAAQTHTLEVPGAALTYDVRPGPGPVLLLIGSPMGAAGFATLASHVEDRTVVTYDPRGAERSRRTDGAAESTPGEHADDLSRLITALDAGPVDVFATSGGAVNALVLVTRHPEQVRTLVAHEPPALAALPDRETALAAARHVHDVYRRSGFGAGMAEFIRLVGHRGPVPENWGNQPADPAAFGLPPEDDGSRDDVLLGQNLISSTSHKHDVAALRAVDARGRGGRRRRVRGSDGPPWRRGRGPADRGRAGGVPRRPRRLPRRRVRPDRGAGGLRGRAAPGPDRRGRFGRGARLTSGSGRASGAVTFSLQRSGGASRPALGL